MSFEKNLSSTARRLGQQHETRLPSTLRTQRDRLLAGLPERQASPSPKLGTLLPLYLVGVGTVGALLLFLPNRHEMFHSQNAKPMITPQIGTAATPRPDSKFQKEVEAAVATAATGHVIFNTPHGQRGELWWQRKPFFYRSQIGNEVLIDDGHTQTQLLPFDDQPIGKSLASGLVITRPSQEKIIYGTFIADSFLLNLELLGTARLSEAMSLGNGGAASNTSSLVHPAVVSEDLHSNSLSCLLETDFFWHDVPVSTSTNQTVVDLQTKLPQKVVTQFRYLPGSPEEEQKRRTMNVPVNKSYSNTSLADYNHPIPASLRKIFIPKNYLPVTESPVPNPHRAVVSPPGIANAVLPYSDPSTVDSSAVNPRLAPLQSANVVSDPSGNIRVTLQLAPDSAVAALEKQPHTLSNIIASDLVATDTEGRILLCAGPSKGSTLPGTFLFAPLEPLQVPGQLSKPLTIEVALRLSVFRRANIDYDRNLMITEDVALSPQNGQQSATNLLGANASETAKPSLEETADFARGEYYMRPAKSAHKPDASPDNNRNSSGMSHNIPAGMNGALPAVVHKLTPEEEYRKARAIFWFGLAAEKAQERNDSARMHFYQGRIRFVQWHLY